MADFGPVALSMDRHLTNRAEAARKKHSAEQRDQDHPDHYEEHQDGQIEGCSANSDRRNDLAQWRQDGFGSDRQDLIDPVKDGPPRCLEPTQQSASDQDEEKEIEEPRDDSEGGQRISGPRSPAPGGGRAPRRRE